MLAGIIVNTGLYSINIAIMGNKSLLNLNKTETVFTKLKPATDKLHDGILGLFGAGRDSGPARSAGITEQTP